MVQVVGAWSCWKLPNKQNRDGYVHLAMNYKDYKAHRVFYGHLIGPIPRGLTLDHLCRRRWCCNPNHVEPVPHRVNVLRGAGPSAANAIKTQCPRGHHYSQRNTYVWNGYRYCRKCHRKHTYDHWKRNRKTPKVKKRCIRGHLLSGENLRPGYGSWRICKICHRLAAREARRQKRADISNI